MEDEKEKIDLSLVCRTCLASQTKFHKLNEIIPKDEEYLEINKTNAIVKVKKINNGDKMDGIDDNYNDDGSDNGDFTFWDYLYYCTRLDDVPDLPLQICSQCCTALKVSYTFIKNALKAHEILTNYCYNYQNNPSDTCKENQRTKLQSSIELPSVGSVEAKKTFRYRCKVCLEKLENKKLLKQHVKLHLDSVCFKCKACSFQTKSRKALSDHYNRIHRIKPSKDMLKVNINLLQQDYETQFTEYVTKKPENVQIIDMDGDIQETFSPSELLAQQQLAELEQQRLMEQQQEHFQQYNNDCDNQQLPIIELQDLQNAEMQFEDSNSQPITIQTTTLPQAMDYQEVITSGGNEYHQTTTTTTDILQHPIQLDATIITTSDGRQIATITQEQLQDLQKSLASNSGGSHTMMLGNDLNVGNEFVVMTDGTVEQVMGNNVFYEYVNPQGSTLTTGSPHHGAGSLTLDNGLVLNNFLSLADNVVVDSSNVDNGISSNPSNQNIINLNVDNIIVDDNHSNLLKVNETSPNKTANMTGGTIQQIVMPKKKIKCKICSSMFVTQERLKTHMLTHNEIPHFFCDQCAFYTFFKVDLTQHYRTKHKLQPTQKQLQPKNKCKIEEESKAVLSCDLCFFETNMKTYLKRHYLYKHKIEPTEVQLRASTTNDEVPAFVNSEGGETPDYPKGIGCKRCDKRFFYRNVFRQHCKQHIVDERRALKKKGQPESGHVLTSPSPSSSSSSTTSLSISTSALASTMPPSIPMTTNKTSLINSATSVGSVAQTNSPSSLANVVSVPSSSYNINYASSASLPAVMTTQICVPGSTVSLNPSSSSLKNTTTPLNITTSSANLQASSSGVVVASASLNLPSLDMMNSPSSGLTPSENASSIINSSMDFDFTGDGNLFEDFEEEDHQENDELTNLVLTSDDDFEDILNDNDDHIDVVNNSPQPYCIQCQRKFLTQYQFENHMFVHRGLAPYRCEMCTNLYNTKRALIRHYKAIHKTMPTRDMIQAKGDKGASTELTFDNLEERKSQILMCFHCPFESSEMQNIKIHLRTSHGILDENYILQKLPYECPQCIRCFAAKARLIRHLERSHAVSSLLQRENVLAANSGSNKTNEINNGDVPISSSIETNNNDNGNHNPSLTLTDEAFPSGISPDEITIAAGVPASLLPVTVSITSPIMSHANNLSINEDHLKESEETKFSNDNLDSDAASLNLRSSIMSTRVLNYKGDNSPFNDDNVIMDNNNDNESNVVVGETLNGCDDFDIAMGDSIEISVTTTGTTIPTSSTNCLDLESSSANNIETETVEDETILTGATSVDGSSPATPLSSMEVENSLTLPLENEIEALRTGTLIGAAKQEGEEEEEAAEISDPAGSPECGDGLLLFKQPIPITASTTSSPSPSPTSSSLLSPRKPKQFFSSSPSSKLNPGNASSSEKAQIVVPLERRLSRDQDDTYDPQPIMLQTHQKVILKQEDQNEDEDVDVGVDEDVDVDVSDYAFYLKPDDLSYNEEQLSEDQKAIQTILVKQPKKFQDEGDERNGGEEDLDTGSSNAEFFTLPSEDFETAEVTITMSATAIGTIIPGADDELSALSNDKSGLHHQTSSSSSHRSSFKPKSVYLCNICSYSCKSVEELSLHNDKHRNSDNIVSPRLASSYECEICHCKYKSVNHLKHHMKRHIARNFRCPQCPKTFISRNELNLHLCAHAGVKPFRCDLCPKKFNYSHHLKRHKEVFHFGKRHKCPVNGCGKVFTTVDQMKLHTLNHNGNIPYKCKFCDRDFKKREHLRSHSRNTHQVNLTEEEIADIYRMNKGYTNPHDFTVADSSGQMLRRNDIEASTHPKDSSQTSILIKNLEDQNE